MEQGNGTLNPMRLTARKLCLGVLLILSFCSTVNADMPQPAVDDPAVRVERMCPESADPDGAAEKRLIRCGLEYGGFAPQAQADTAPQATMRIAAYNLERGFELEKQIRLFQKHEKFKDMDILLVSEADRGCARTEYRNVARDMARALAMNYVYGVEFVELPRPGWPEGESCEHGNAVLTRWPIVNAEEIRHTESADWYIEPGAARDGREPRLGGRMAVMADITVNGRPLRVYAVHFDSGMHEHAFRGAQARQLAAHAAAFPGPVVIGGDMNTFAYAADLASGGTPNDSTVPALTDAGYADAHAAIKPHKRGTTRVEYGVRMVIDLIFVKDADIQDSGICPAKICDPLSDHLPVWTEIRLK